VDVEQPRVLDIYPQHLYEGEPSSVKVEAGLGLKAGPVEVEVGPKERAWGRRESIALLA